MKSLLGNSCAKGCLVYFVALVVIVTLTALGIGGLSARFGVGAQTDKPQASILTTGRQQAPPASQPGSVADANPPSGPSETSTVAPFAPLPNVDVGSLIQQAPQPQPTTQPQSGGLTGISSDTVSPFYIVQAGDTLWSIAQSYGVDTDALKAANNVISNFIQPGQLLYLPQPGQQQAPASAPASAPVPAATATTDLSSAPSGDQGGSSNASSPEMPHTGINSKP